MSESFDVKVKVDPLMLAYSGSKTKLKLLGPQKEYPSIEPYLLLIESGASSVMLTWLPIFTYT